MTGAIAGFENASGPHAAEHSLEVGALERWVGRAGGGVGEASVVEATQARQRERFAGAVGAQARQTSTIAGHDPGGCVQ